jgi:peptide/nickel transport system permease protein
MRVIEIFMAIPRLFLLLTIIAFIPPEWNKYMLYAMMAVIGLTSWMGSARFIRAEFFKLRNQDYVLAGPGVRPYDAVDPVPAHAAQRRHPVLVQASFGVAAAIFVETGLSFLGFGIKPPNPSWGQMLSRAVDPTTGVFNWWLAVFPGILIFLTVFGFNLIGDALRDAIDPKLKKQSAI